MEIKYTKPINLFKFLEDSYFIVNNKKKILKNKKYPFYNSIKREMLPFVGYILLLFICLWMQRYERILFFEVMSYIIGIFIGLMTILYLNLICSYYKIKKRNLSGVLTIDESGITDEDEKIKFTYKWDSITYVIIGKYSINILLKDTAFYLRLPINIEKTLIKEINKYAKIEIIDLVSNSE